MAVRLKKRYYSKGCVVPFEEDATHEFKGHRNLSVEEVPPWAVINQKGCSHKSSRKAVSRTINGFLNSGKGATVYLGIIDDGTVKGMKLTRYQKDHVVTNLDDLASRYNPPMEKHRYKIRFVPVLDNNSTDDEISTLLSSIEVNDDVDPESRQRPHKCQTFEYCWCDKDAVAVYNNGCFAPDYVIEIKIKPWDPDDPRNHHLIAGTETKLSPIHEDEEGNVYFRRQASLVTYSLKEIWDNTKQEVKELCQAEIDRLRKEIFKLKYGSDEV